MKVVLFGVPYMNTRIPPLSIALLAGHLKAHGFEVKSFDFSIDAYQRAPAELKKHWSMTQGYTWSEPETYEKILLPLLIQPHLDDWCGRVVAENPAAIGISVTASPVAKVFARELRRRLPQARIIFGGPSCSRFYGDKSYMDPGLGDAVVDGEGEEVLLELLTQLREEGGFRKTPGAAVNLGGIFVEGPIRPPIAALDGLAPPDFTDFPLSQYTDEDSYGGKKDMLELPVYSSRGCVAKCHFCMDYKMWQSFRFKSPRNFVQELKGLGEKYGAKQFFFIELLLNGSLRWARDYVAEMKANGLSIPFHSHGRLSRGMTPELLRGLKEVGLFHLNYGLESASDKVLKAMAKGYGAKEASQCIIDTHRAGITMTINLVIGYPGENTWDWLKTLWFIVRHHKYIYSKPNLAICDVIPGSDLYNSPEKFKIVVKKNDPQFYMTWESQDGKNTYRVRKFRRDVMDWVFSRLRFHEWEIRNGGSGAHPLGVLERLKKLYIAQPRKKRAA